MYYSLVRGLNYRIFARVLMKHFLFGKFLINRRASLEYHSIFIIGEHIFLSSQDSVMTNELRQGT